MELIKTFGIKTVIRMLLTTIHIKIIKAISLNKPLIIGVEFNDGVNLSNENKSLIIANCKFKGI